MADMTIKQGDRLPKLRATLQQGTPPAAIDLTTAVAVKFQMRLVSNPATVKGPGACTIVTAASGIVEYAWGASDTDTAGTWEAEFEIEWSGGLKETVPNDGYFTVTIVDDIA
jgi:hypothetical protein